MSRRMRINNRIKRIAAVPAAIFGIILIFLAIYYVPDKGAETVGNTRYTDSEVRQMVLTSFKARNSLYLAYIEKTVKVDVPFIDSIDIEYIGHNKVRLHVNENNPIGYIREKGMDYFFDVNGQILEAIAVEGYDPSEEEEEESVESSSEEVTTSSSEETPKVEGDPLIDLDGDGIFDVTVHDIYLIDTDWDGYPDQTTAGEVLLDTDGDGIPDASPVVEEPEPEEEAVTAESQDAEAANGAESTDAEEDAKPSEETTATSTNDGALQAVMEKTSDTDFHPALTDVTQVKGLKPEKLEVKAVIPVASKTVFPTIQALMKMNNKLQIRPDSLELDEAYHMTLYYGDIRVMIGGDSLLEEKMSRVAAILPKLEGKKGTLHLETFNSDTVNIVFDEENS